MGKGGANPYPLWWATSNNSNNSHKNELPKYYKSEKDKEREYWDAYYKEKSWSQRRKEFEKQFREDFLKGKFFYDEQSSKPKASYANPKASYAKPTNNDIDPIFKIKKSSSQEDFKKAYRKLILKHHPDKGGDSKLFIKIQEAWEKLHFAS